MIINYKIFVYKIIMLISIFFQLINFFTIINLGEKDANAILCKYGKEAIINAIHNAKLCQISGVIDCATVDDVDIFNSPKIRTNIKEIDEVINGMYLGQLILLTGRTGQGKSTFMSQLIIEALEQNYSTFIYSGELSDYHVKYILKLQSAGQANIDKFTDENSEVSYFVNQEVTKKLNAWYSERVWIYNNDASLDDNSLTLLETMEMVICRYGVQFLCVDNVMSSMDFSSKTEINKAQSEFAKKLKLLARKYNVVILLVAHPRKTNNKIELDDISGSADLVNRSDTVMSYSRANPEDFPNLDKDLNTVAKLSIIKNRLTAKTTDPKKPILLLYDNISKRIYSSKSYHKTYSWNTIKHIDHKPEFEPEVEFKKL